ncbi:hypothetical protein N7507_007908 [Penicillium longicatenatum]|nr:hypothetical protein N7507_007908 [Penicillium longicatenatum]
MDREIYLSPSYNCLAHKESLGILGITEISLENILRLLTPYLEGVCPRFLSPELDNDWHKRVAELLIGAIETQPEKIEQIRRMLLIPSSDGTLLSTVSSRVYFPADVNGIYIPYDLNINIMAYEALEDKTREKLFWLLGVTPCSPEYVKSLILRRYNRPGDVTLQDSVAHLIYLFWSSDEGALLNNRIYLMDQHELPVYRVFVPYGVEITVDDLYFQTSGKYGTVQLALDLQAINYDYGEEEEQQQQQQEEQQEQQREQQQEQQEQQQEEEYYGDDYCAIHIIHEAYIDAVPQEARVFGLSWMEWLEKAALIRHVPRFVNPRTGELSDLFRRIVEVDPIKFLGLFKSHQALYNREITPGAIEEIRSLEVPCTDNELNLLNDTYYPSKKMKEICEWAGFGDSFDWFLDIDDDWPTDNISKWNFLAEFGVGMRPDPTFFSKIFIKLEENVDPEDAVAGAIAMYDELSKRFLEDELKHLFEDSVSVLVPSNGEIYAEWRQLEDCLWMGHPSLLTKRPLSIHEDFVSRPHVVQLFTNVLCLDDADLTTYLREVEFYKAQCQIVEFDGVNSEDTNPEYISPEHTPPESTNPEFTQSGDLVLSDHHFDGLNSEYLEWEENEVTQIYVNLSALIAMYEEIDQRAMENEDACHIRAIFNDKELVYLPSQELWVSPNLCVWAAAPKIGRQYGISKTYGHLARFFQDILHVRDPSTETYIESS